MPSFEGIEKLKTPPKPGSGGVETSEHDQADLTRVLLTSRNTAAVPAAEDSDGRGRANLENRSLHPVSKLVFARVSPMPTRIDAWLRFQRLEVNSLEVRKSCSSGLL